MSWSSGKMCEASHWTAGPLQVPLTLLVMRSPRTRTIDRLFEIGAINFCTDRSSSTVLWIQGDNGVLFSPSIHPIHRMQHNLFLGWDCTHVGSNYSQGRKLGVWYFWIWRIRKGPGGSSKGRPCQISKSRVSCPFLSFIGCNSLSSSSHPPIALPLCFSVNWISYWADDDSYEDFLSWNPMVIQFMKRKASEQSKAERDGDHRS